MNTKKILALLLAILCTMCCFVACGDYSEDAVKAYALKGPTGMGMAKLMNDKATDNYTYDFTLADSPEDVKAEILKGNFDIAAVPTNLAATLYQKTNKSFEVIAVNTLGVLYVLENGNTIQSIADLNGKTIQYFGQGSTPEYMIQYILQKNGISANLQAVDDNAQLATDMSANTVTLAILPEPSVSAAMAQAATKGNTSLRVALDLTAEWKNVSNNNVPMQGCIIASKAFLEEIGEKGLEALLEDLEASYQFAATDATAPAVITAQGVIPKEPIAKKAIANLGTNLCFITGNEMKTQLSAFLQILHDANPQAVGGTMPDDGFYAIA